jgi:hypothetical protein
MTQTSRQVLQGIGRWVQEFGIQTAPTAQQATVDYTAQLQHAMNETNGPLLFDGWVKVTNMLDCHLNCIPWSIKGARRGGISVGPDFNLSAFAVMRMRTDFFNGGDFIAGFGPQIESFGFSFDQSAAIAAWGTLPTVNPNDPVYVAARNSIITQYPRAIGFVTNGSRPKFKHIYIENGWDGIIADGNQGGADFDHLEVGCLNRCVSFDRDNPQNIGSRDFLRIQMLHQWQFGAGDSAALASLHRDGVAKALYLGDVDGWGIDNLVAHDAQVIVNNPHALLPGQGAPFNGAAGSFIPHQFGRVTMDSIWGVFRFERGWGMLQNYSGQDKLIVTGGYLTVTGPTFNVLNGPAVEVLGTGQCRITGGQLHNRQNDRVGMRVSEGGLLSVNSLDVVGAPGNRSAPMFDQVGASAVLQINDIDTFGVAANWPLVRIGADNTNNYVNMTGNKYHLPQLPTSTALGNYVTPHGVWPTPSDA